MDTRYLVVTTTIDTKEDAELLAKKLVEDRLVACAQIEGPLKSVYWWEGKPDSSSEWRVTLKTRAANYREVEKMIKKHHTYDLPQIVATPIVLASQEYLSWIDSNTGK